MQFGKSKGIKMNAQTMLFGFNSESLVMRDGGESTLVGKLQAKLDRQNIEAVKAQNELYVLKRKLHVMEEDYKRAVNDYTKLSLRYESQTRRVIELTDLVRQLQNGAKTAAEMPKEVWRRLLQLCHPDKHNGSEAATMATQWLNANKPAY